MSRSKKTFVALGIVFLLALGYASYDISSRTTFPGSRPQLKERLENEYHHADTLRQDSLARGAKKL